jgi:hypothetical protein
MPDDGEIDEMSRLCAVHCLESSDPQGCVNCFTERLVMIRGWTRQDANEVAHRAIEVIAYALGDDSLIKDA